MSRNAHTLNQEVFQNIHISSHEYMILKSFELFYEDPLNVKILLSIINSTDKTSKISIRLIDYFVTKFSKNNKVNFKLDDQPFYIYNSYKQQLKGYQKKHFDPFSRGDRIPYFMDNYCIITTIGQLNFFKWFISKKIYEYIKNNKLNIENEMNQKNKKEKKIKKNIKKINTKPINNTFTNNTNNNDVIKNNKIIVYF
jgi:hypothetical protein